MAMSVTYANFCGQIVQENRGGTQSFYVGDTLGSTAALVGTNGTVTDTWSYWPYGEVQSRTGSTGTPFTFVGILGYFQDLLDNLAYIRARFLRLALGRWQTVDPLLTLDSPYSYAAASPAKLVDPSGLVPSGGSWCANQHDCAGSYQDGLNEACHALRKPWGPSTLSDINACIATSASANGARCPRVPNANCLRNGCRGGATVVCSSDCPASGPGNCGGLNGTTITICTNNTAICGSPSGIPPTIMTILHELSHGCGVDHRYPDICAEIYACCIAKVLLGLGTGCNKKLSGPGGYRG